MNIFEKISATSPILSEGSHDRPEQGVCVMELISILDVSDTFGDYPRCVDSGLIRFAQMLNDSLNDEYRQKLLDFIPRMLGTSSADGSKVDKALQPVLAAYRDRAVEGYRTEYYVTESVAERAVDSTIAGNLGYPGTHLNRLLGRDYLHPTEKLELFGKILDAYDEAAPERSPVELDVEAVKLLVEVQQGLRQEDTDGAS